jgi:general secretion pathway protein F
MRTFSYRGFREGGTACSGLIEALDLKDAREKLSTQGVMPERVQAAEGQRRGVRWRQAAFHREARGEFYRELGILLRAGLPLLHALEVLLETPERDAGALALAALRDRIRDGRALASAMAEVTPEVTEFERAALTAGERAGSLEAVLSHLADYLEEQGRAREQLQSALIYPAIVLALAALVTAGLMGVMLPNLGRLLSEANVPLPALTRGMLAVGHYTGSLGLPILAVAVLAIVLYVRHVKADLALKETWERRFLSWPGLGRGWGLVLADRFCRTMALLLRGGVPLVESMELAGPATGSVWVSGLLKKGAEAIRHGQSVSNALRSVPPLSKTLPGWVHAGEASGRLEEIFERAGERYRLQWQRRVRRALTVLEPALILAVGLLVLVVALSVLLPILSLNRTLQ